MDSQQQQLTISTCDYVKAIEKEKECSQTLKQIPTGDEGTANGQEVDIVSNKEKSVSVIAKESATKDYVPPVKCL